MPMRTAGECVFSFKSHVPSFYCISAVQSDEGEEVEMQIMELVRLADSPVLGIHAKIISYTHN